MSWLTDTGLHWYNTIVICLGSNETCEERSQEWSATTWTQTQFRHMESSARQGTTLTRREWLDSSTRRWRQRTGVGACQPPTQVWQDVCGGCQREVRKVLYQLCFRMETSILILGALLDFPRVLWMKGGLAMNTIRIQNLRNLVDTGDKACAINNLAGAE